jgi:hypothetical protein
MGASDSGRRAGRALHRDLQPRRLPGGPAQLHLRLRVMCYGARAVARKQAQRGTSETLEGKTQTWN